MSEELEADIELAEKLFKKVFDNDSVAWRILKMAQAFADDYMEKQEATCPTTGESTMTCMCAKCSEYDG